MNISKTVRERAILSDFFTHRVVQECPMQKGKISIFATFGGYLGFQQKINIENIFKMVRDRAISSEFLIHSVVQQYSVPTGKTSSWILVENEKL